MARTTKNRAIQFRGTPDGALERAVELSDGRQYAHRCSKEVFEAVAGYLEEHKDEDVKLLSLADALDAPKTQVDVAVKLLIERGMLKPHGRLSRVEPGYARDFYNHAMTEFDALVEGHPPKIVPRS